LSIQEVV